MGNTLYKRLGGHEGLSAIVHYALNNHLKHPAITVRFENADIPKLQGIAVEFFGMGSGGPEHYSGRDLLEAHKGMNISEREFVDVIDDILAALDKKWGSPGKPDRSPGHPVFHERSDCARLCEVPLLAAYRSPTSELGPKTVKE